MSYPEADKFAGNNMAHALDFALPFPSLGAVLLKKGT
jgi:hypothetical protein